MADSRKIVVTIVQEAPRADDPNEKATGESEKAEASENAGLSDFASWIAHQALSEAVGAIRSESEYQISRYFSTRDDYIGQRNMGAARAMVGNAVGFGAAVFAGARAGSSAGGWGALAGAAIGAASWGVTKAIGGAQALDAQVLGLAKMDAQLGYARQRSGWSLTSGSVGEDR